jgi:hypothetical protein
MAASFSAANFGEPDLTIAGFQLWIHGRQFPDALDKYDGNWLQVTAHVGASGASVWAQGAILMTSDIARFREQCQVLRANEAQSAVLESYEPELRLVLEQTDSFGHIRARVEITPDHLSQQHQIEVEIDQSYLPQIERQCAVILAEYPVRD